MSMRYFQTLKLIRIRSLAGVFKGPTRNHYSFHVSHVDFLEMLGFMQQQETIIIWENGRTKCWKGQIGKKESQETTAAYHAVSPIDIMIPCYYRQVFPLQFYPKRLNVKIHQEEPAWMSLQANLSWDQAWKQWTKWWSREERGSCNYDRGM